MARLVPLTHRKLRKKLRKLGWDGPHKRRGNHFYMVKGTRKLSIPNPHGPTIDDPGLVKDILNRFGISVDDWLDE